TMTAKPEAMKKAAQRGFINATDLADYLVRKGLPFRSAYKISGAIVGDCVKSGAVLEELPLETYQQYSDLFDSDVYEAIDLTACVEKRTSAGGPAKVQEQIDYVTACLAKGDF
ncbi:argininosuccinate lyase, partial [human gut metagenome]